jgi:hypothetical protein
MATHNHFEYFIKTISNLDKTFIYSKNEYEALKEYIEKIDQSSLIQRTVTDLHIQNQNSTQHMILTQPLNELLDKKFLSQFNENKTEEVHFMMVFSDDESDYSSHVRIVGMLAPQFTYQVMVRRLNPFEEGLLFTLQLALYTMWEASMKGTYPWVTLTDY